ncbi:MAG: endonuclease domain-containing protein [Sphingobium sp.]|nr:endonuclease domain-containing protein [Sphingobium sp.]MCI1270393.1 endonuclease domain-containing protein [Sphingobium sp.]MCI1755540.1 endonuclease domain-containing protein [Sphingobium sp.]MCI2052082.1 endonuclease domain-containing protein [Sphingobium sp.]
MWLVRQGVRVLRVPASEVLRDVEAVIQHIVMTALPLHRPADGPPPLAGEN